METKILYYKIFEKKVEPIDYVNWACEMLANGISSTSLNILSSLREPLNIFEVEDYFYRAVKEIDIQEPSHEYCAKYFIRYLLKQIIDDEYKAIDNAYEIYKVIREHFINDEWNVWYEISEMIDDYQFGDNVMNITGKSLISSIVNEANKQLKLNFLLN
ncbi:hypothetical protein [Lysinibacillus sp. RS5]|uniref:hypothetical protein n=1 Tax=unclassified Lysinibacillus TaxID=2636778 RepID=UPI0035BE7C04